MNNEIDMNTIAVEFIKYTIENFFDGIRSFFKDANNKLKIKQSYSDYIHSITQKYSTAKSFFLKGESVYLYDFYTPLDIGQGKNALTDVGIGDILNNEQNLIITGTGGCGKSMIVRHLLLNSLITKSKVPIFIELRQFNDFEGDLIALLIKTLNMHKFALNEKYAKEALESGRFILFLDGYDEVAHKQRNRVKLFIKDFVHDYENCKVILTSRPDPELEGWQLFSIFEVAPVVSR